MDATDGSFSGRKESGVETKESARRNESKDQRTKDRLKALQIGFVQARRAKGGLFVDHGDRLLYTLYEHLFDLADSEVLSRQSTRLPLGDCADFE